MLQSDEDCSTAIATVTTSYSTLLYVKGSLLPLLLYFPRAAAVAAADQTVTRERCL